MSLDDNLKALIEEAKAGIRAEFNAVLKKMGDDYQERSKALEAKQERIARLIIEGYEKKIAALEAENARLREGLAKSVKIDPYGSIENADARDTARALLYQVPALPLDEEANRIVEDMVRRAKQGKVEERKPLPRREEPWGLWLAKDAARRRADTEGPIPEWTCACGASHKTRLHYCNVCALPAPETED